MRMEPYGLDAIVAFERLPFLKVGAFAGGQSSFDRAGFNDDGFTNDDFANDGNQFLGIDAAGDWIMLDLKGAGVVYRLWFTGFHDDAYIKVYVDGALVLNRCNLSTLFPFEGEHGRPPRPGRAPEGFPGLTTPFIDTQSGGSYW